MDERHKVFAGETAISAAVWPAFRQGLIIGAPDPPTESSKRASIEATGNAGKRVKAAASPR